MSLRLDSSDPSDLDGSTDAGSKPLGAAERGCGSCSLCCVVLRVDELGKLGGEPCPHIRPEGGCGIYETRPKICRGYRCLWLKGGLDDADRPDSLGAVVDLLSVGTEVRMGIQEAAVGAFDSSPRLRAIAERYRETGPVRVVEAGDVLNPDRPYRVLQSDGRELRACGEWLTEYRFGEVIAERRLPWIERIARRFAVALRTLRLRWARRFSRMPDSKAGSSREFDE